jgi:peroxin-1
MSFAQVLSVVSSSSKLAELSKAKEQKKDEQLHNFSRIAGLQVAKDTILETMEAPFKYSYLYKELPIKMPKGVLLYGPSGVGKTYLANAVKEQVRISFFEFKGSDILNMYIGASEQAVRDIFETAMSVAPSVVFFDEFESIVPKRTANNTGVTDRIVNQFLCYLDGVSSLEGVFLMAASSRPEMIDPALLRPGRIDKHVYLDYPNEQERAELLTIYQHAISFEYPTEDIVSKTVNYSYSDMVGLLKELRIKKAGVLLKQEKYEKSDFKFISKDFFDSIQKGYRLSSTPQQQAMQRRRY